MPVKELAILGAGGNCREILRALQDINDASAAPVYRCIAILDDSGEQWGNELNGVTIRGPIEDAGSLKDCAFVNSIGSPNNFWLKEEIIRRSGIDTARFATIVHPGAAVPKGTKLPPGVVVFANVTLGVDACIGEHVVVLPNSVISHDDSVGAYTCIASAVCLSGEVTVGRSCYLGAGSSFINGVHVGDYALVGMGSVVIRDVPPETVVAGNPARILRTLART